MTEELKNIQITLIVLTILREFILTFQLSLAGGPYEDLAGHDATRAFAKFQTDLVSEDYEDLSDLSPDERSQAKDWEEQMAEKYEFVGKLIRPGDEPTVYSDDEDKDEDKQTTAAGEKKSD